MDFLLTVLKSEKQISRLRECAENAKRTIPFQYNINDYYQNKNLRLWVWGGGKGIGAGMATIYIMGTL
ncbi:hypothetical protein N561_06375 [Gallibacterium anatis 12656/12]|uniref:Uncharacterized protein n=1 Tax=Gallibacterium anatis 12656/12 TaxID=1195244 RepID=U1H1Y4_9PAST|nr:hypothetical protein N561_06375 [Gallibacterium anatis 12656/12]